MLNRIIFTLISIYFGIIVLIGTIIISVRNLVWQIKMPKMTDFERAILYDDTETVLLELKNGADPNIRLLSTIKSRTLRRHAVKYPDMLEYADTALTAAALRGCKPVVTALLDNGANIDIIKVNNSTALLNALAANDSEMVDLLLSRKADVNAHLDSNDTALMIVSYEGNVEFVNLLISHGADVNIFGDQGETALIVASQGCHPDVVKILLEAGAYINAQDEEGHSAMDIAITNNCTEVIEILAEWS